MVRFAGLAVLAGTLALVGLACTSKEEDLFALRRENRESLDALYARYGGGALAAELKKESEKGADEARQQPDANAAVEFLKVVGNAASEVDRVAFEAQCEELGQGSRPVILNDKAKVFFANHDVEDSCAVVAVRATKILKLERELGLAPPSAP